MALNILNDTQIRKAKPENKEYKLSDGGGLSISVKLNGSKTWILNCINPQNDKKTNVGLGTNSCHGRRKKSGIQTTSYTRHKSSRVS